MNWSWLTSKLLVIVSRYVPLSSCYLIFAQVLTRSPELDDLEFFLEQSNRWCSVFNSSVSNNTIIIVSAVWHTCIMMYFVLGWSQQLLWWSQYKLHHLVPHSVYFVNSYKIQEPPPQHRAFLEFCNILHRSQAVLVSIYYIHKQPGIVYNVHLSENPMQMDKVDIQCSFRII